MNILLKLITKCVCFGKAKAGNLSLVETGHEPSRFDAMWDEALISSMHCETARMFLDHMGPRGK